MSGRPVLVGVGGGPEGRQALNWALREAQSRHTGLQLVRAYHVDTQLLPWETAGDRMITASFRAAAEHLLGAALEHVRATAPDLPVEGAIEDAPAWDVLVQRSADAALTVVGSRHHSVLGASLIGSTSGFVAAGGHGPVVVVTGALPGPDGPRSATDDTGAPPAVVVGIDDRLDAHDVLTVAVDVADRRGCPLHAVFCARPHLGRAVDLQAGERWLAERVAGWRDKYPDVPVLHQVLDEHPVVGLTAAALGHELLVVGARTTHARTGSWLGSVSQGALHHAPCPIAVVHAH